jgi:HTH-type transcriptional regulator/antitoxin HipB
MPYPIQTPSQLSSHLRALRNERGLSQAGLGALLGLSQTRIARIEADPLSISAGQLLRILSVLGMRMTLEPLTNSISATAVGADATPSTLKGDW